ncbi:competence protein [Philodulcilactobacillus myokoensis]|uniref:Competence protein n=1 Tax=Philodulcilactobacillus myokoensis TaxID=2929573 RepID=A0A9W6B1C4_9LACO|nr:helix-hairpin-helix domain-containing protein [Philodulcilactobacillus myokoensis]GLB46991.1 competence protein [Philodulcilactobacillus myokoensis]
MDRIKEFINEYRRYLMIGSVVIVVLILIILFSNHQGDSQTNFSNNMSQASSMNTNSSSKIKNLHQTSNSFSQTSHNNLVVVDVKGAVKQPGVYRLPSSLRIDDAVEAAGGLTKSADGNHVNLAQKLNDQQVIYVPFRGEIKGKIVTNVNNTSSSQTSDISGSSSDSTSNKINLNTADENELQKINGVGEKKAQKILDYRKEHGDFNKIEDIKNIPGFGDRSFDNIKNFICVQ